MSHYDYYNTTPRELVELMEGWARRHSRYLEGVRVIAHTIAQVNSTKKIPAPHIWMPLPTDEKKTTGPRVPSEKEKLAAAAVIRSAKERGKLQAVKIVD